MDDQNMKKFMIGTAMAGALGLGVLGLGSGVASAKPHHGPNPNPPGPSVTHNNGGANAHDNDYDDDNEYDNDDDGDVTNWTPGMPPGQNPLGPPGQVMKLPTIGGVDNPFYGTPPGHWRDLAINIPETWQPNLPGVTEPLPLEFNASLGQWGVYVDGQFVAYPIPLPAPTS